MYVAAFPLQMLIKTLDISLKSVSLRLSFFLQSSLGSDFTFHSLFLISILFQGQTRCAGPAEKEGILPRQCYSPSFSCRFVFVFHTLSPSLCFLTLLWVQLEKNLQIIENVKQ